MKRAPLAPQCPSCGNPVSLNARSCGRCGARRRGDRWDEPESLDGLDLPDEDFDYDEFVRREFGEGKARRSFQEHLWWWVALILLIAFAFSYVIAF